jgi:hypothetical protein
MGDPEEAGREYLRINFREHRVASGADGAGVPDLHARIIRAQLEDGDGRRIENVAEGEPIRIDLTLEARVDMADPHFNLTVVDDDGDLILEYEPKLPQAPDGSTALGTGERVRLRGRLENPLTPGRYKVHCWVSRSSNVADLALQTLDVFDFVVYGTGGRLAKVRAEGEISATRRGDGR